MTTERDFRNQMRYFKETTLAEGRAEGMAKGLEEGRAKGLAEGLAEGQKVKAVEIAVKLMGTGMSRTEAAAFVGISEDELEIEE